MATSQSPYRQEKFDSLTKLINQIRSADAMGMSWEAYRGNATMTNFEGDVQELSAEYHFKAYLDDDPQRPRGTDFKIHVPRPVSIEDLPVASPEEIERMVANGTITFIPGDPRFSGDDSRVSETHLKSTERDEKG